MKKTSANIFVIFGVTGDLSNRKIFPALNDIFLKGKLSSNFFVIGCGRSSSPENVFAGLDSEILKNAEYIKINPVHSSDFDSLEKIILFYKEKFKEVNVLFYLSTPPSAYSHVINNLIIKNLNTENSGYRRIIIEKPFGNDQQSSIELNKLLSSGFNENQIYRIDHYLGKETVQNILVSRFSNIIFSQLWCRKFISYIEITASESIGIENRGEYYDNSGAIKDMFQNHLLELLCLVAMEEPKTNSSEDIRNEKLNILEKIKKIDFNNIVRGQYTESTVKNKKYNSYTDTKGVKSDSKTETFFACKLFIENDRWKDVPFFIRTGKRLPTKVTEIVINFKKNINVFNDNSPGNRLIFRLQPDEGMLIKFNLKKPAERYSIINKNLEFHYKSLGHDVIDDAYETLLIDVMKGSTMLFSRSDFVEKAWGIIDPIIDGINKNKIKLYAYKSGTWGPLNSNELFRNENTWRYPCKNLVNDGEICEL